MLISAIHPQSKVNQDDFEGALRETFIVKDDDNIAALMAAAVEELKAGETDMLEYQQLFTEVCDRLLKHRSLFSSTSALILDK